LEVELAGQLGVGQVEARAQRLGHGHHRRQRDRVCAEVFDDEGANVGLGWEKERFEKTFLLAFLQVMTPGSVFSSTLLNTLPHLRSLNSGVESAFKASEV